nr:hypothetical protein [Streptomyces sp. P9(2023)]
MTAHAATRGVRAEHGVPLPVGFFADYGELDGFAGRDDVTVVGTGQAALETAAILTERGTRARILARSGRLNWNTLPPALDRGLWQSVRAPHTGLGCGWHNRLYADTPGLFRQLPAPTRERIFDSALGPAGAWWLRERFAAVGDVRLGTHTVVAASTADERLRLDASGRTGRLSWGPTTSSRRPGSRRAWTGPGCSPPRSGGRSARWARAGRRRWARFRVLQAGPVPRRAADGSFVRALDALRVRRGLHGRAAGARGAAAAAGGLAGRGGPSSYGRGADAGRAGMTKGRSRLASKDARRDRP